MARINKILELAALKYKEDNSLLNTSYENYNNDTSPVDDMLMTPTDHLTQTTCPKSLNLSACTSMEYPSKHQTPVDDMPISPTDHLTEITRPKSLNLAASTPMEYLSNHQNSLDLSSNSNIEDEQHYSNCSDAKLLSPDNENVCKSPNQPIPQLKIDETVLKPHLNENEGNPGCSSTNNVDINQPNSANVVYSVAYNRKRPTLLRLKKMKNYYVSPIHSEESDADDSNDDPDFIDNKSLDSIRKSPSVNMDAHQSEESDATTGEEPKKGKKRKQNPQEWQAKKTKLLRNSGKAYTSCSKSKKKYPERKIRPACGEKCRLGCSKKINDGVRKSIFQSYWDLADVEKQREFIAAHTNSINPKYRYSSTQNFRGMNLAFYFESQNNRIRVCKTFFKSTLDISDRPIRTTIMKKSDTGFIAIDNRGRHGKQPTVNPEIKDSVRKFINSIPRIESHYLRAQTTREYIEGGRSLADLYRDYKEEREETHLPVANLVMFNRIFNKEFNISFYVPKKDQCDLCEAYKNADEEGKQKLMDSYSHHLKEKQLSREEKKRDKDNANIHVAVYDLQAVMPLPKGQVSSFFYKSKLNCYNFTISDLFAKNVDCYFWNETEGRRGAVEIGSCILHYLKLLAENENRRNLDVVFYSDNCCGQQKNKYLLAAYFYAVTNFKIRSITHKFLIHGHSQNEGDNVHSVIEKQVKRHIKSGPIYIPEQYVSLIRTAKKTGRPYRVHEFTHEDFYDLKILQEEVGKNFNINTEKKKVKWNEIKVLRVVTDQPRIFYYKTSYEDDIFMIVNVLKAKDTRSQTNYESTPLVRAYDKGIPLPENKKKDLQELVNKNIIPKKYYNSFYSTILSV